MKKKLTTLMTAMLVLVAAFALTACGKPNLEDWYAKNTDQFQEVTDTVNAQAETMGCTMEFVVEDGNALVMRYTLTEALDVSDPTVADALTQAYDSMFDSYNSMFSELRTQLMEETSTEDVIIRLDVLNADGTELYTRDFTE